MINEHERIDDLQLNGLHLIQDPSLFCFGMDAVLLSSFSKLKKQAKVVDLGTGNGILPVLLCGKYQPSNIIGIELQQANVSLATRNMAYNKLDDIVTIKKGNVKDIKDLIPAQWATVVVSNPPYKKINSGIINEQVEKAIAKHELEGTLEDFIKAAAHVLCDYGQLYMINRPERLADCLTLMRKYKIEPKHLQFVLPYQNEKPNLFLIKGSKYGNQFLQVDKNLVVRKDNGEYTEDLLALYESEKK